jgi:hypothetical protein
VFPDERHGRVGNTIDSNSEDQGFISRSTEVFNFGKESDLKNEGNIPNINTKNYKY